jgi:hypothetical protein
VRPDPFRESPLPGIRFTYGKWPRIKPLACLTLAASFGPGSRLHERESRRRDHTIRRQSLHFSQNGNPTLPTSAALAAMITFSSAERADTVQSIAPGYLDAYQGGLNNGFNPLGTVVLADGTNSLIDISGSMKIADQGWGNQVGNNVYFGLFLGSTDLINGFAAHAGHTADTHVPQYTFQTYDLASDPTLLANFNSVLAGIDWSSSPTVSVELFWDGTGYPGYEAHVNSALMTVTSDVVPDGGTTIALLGMGLAGMVTLRRKFARA